jgi:hypothetical protein
VEPLALKISVVSQVRLSSCFLNLWRLLNLILQGSLTRLRDLEREKLTSARLAEIGVGELFLK